MKLIKHIVLWLPVRMVIKLIECLFTVNHHIFKGKYEKSLLYHYSKIVNSETNKWYRSL